jgi:copper chaperone NosL
MKNKLSITSRILVAFASGALIAVFFLPAWRIDLFAPQYPEGLTMNIWINGLTGDVDVINGLNHYIGMQHITVDMFPEFKYLPFVVGFFMLLGMIVAVTGQRKFLLAYLIITAIGGAFAMYDFYKWGYDYGHNLDPTAPIQISGLSYQPPLFGHKRLLNFDAYSFPDVGGWIVIAAAGLAFTVWFTEWYRLRRRKSSFQLKSAPAIAACFLLIMVTSCSVGPEPFKTGEDICYTCKMGIIDTRFGCEIITNKGKAYKFDDVICLSRFLKAGIIPEESIHQSVVIKFDKADQFLDIKNAFFAVSPSIKSPMQGCAAAFSRKEDAEKMKNEKNGVILNWREYYSKVQ